MTQEEQLLKFQNHIGIKVQSVVLPVKSNVYVLKTEAQILDWLQNKIHSQHSAFYQFKNKYTQNSEELSWYNNKLQNQRFLETSGR